MGMCATACTGGEFHVLGRLRATSTTTACGSNGCCIPSPCMAKSCSSTDICTVADASGAATCTDPCSMVTLPCPRTSACRAPAWASTACTQGSCPTGQVCTGSPAQCQPDPCAGVSCPSDQYCNAGACVTVCPACAAGEMCTAGKCVADPCMGGCVAAGETCIVVSGTPMCAQNLCATTTCQSGQACCGGTCLADPCAALSCPSGTTCGLDSMCNAACGHFDGGTDRVVAAGSNFGCSVAGVGGDSRARRARGGSSRSSMVALVGRRHRHAWLGRPRARRSRCGQRRMSRRIRTASTASEHRDLRTARRRSGRRQRRGRS